MSQDVEELSNSLASLVALRGALFIAEVDKAVDRRNFFVSALYGSRLSRRWRITSHLAQAYAPTLPIALANARQQAGDHYAKTLEPTAVLVQIENGRWVTIAQYGAG